MYKTLKNILNNKNDIINLENTMSKPIRKIVSKSNKFYFSLVGLNLLSIIAGIAWTDGFFLFLSIFCLMFASFMWIPYYLILIYNKTISKPEFLNKYETDFLLSDTVITEMERIYSFFGYKEKQILNELKKYSHSKGLFISLIYEKINNSSYEELVESKELLQSIYQSDFKKPDQINKIQKLYLEKIKAFEDVEGFKYKKNNNKIQVKEENNNKIKIKVI
jgi:hypothetical protein